MKRGLAPAESRPDEAPNDPAKLLYSFANYMILISGCYWIAILATQLMIYRREGQWIGAIRPLYAKVTDSNVSANSADSHLLSYALDSVNALLLVGGAMVLFGVAKLALGSRVSSKCVSMKPLIA